MDLVSVIIPTYNRGGTIIRAIQSVISQTYSNLEIIVVDDCSSDNTEELVSSIDDARLVYLKLNENVGGSSARNEGLQICRGEFITFLDSDDEFLPTKVEEQYKALKSSEENVGMVVCGRIDRLTGQLVSNWKPNFDKLTTHRLLAHDLSGCGTP